MASSGCSGRIFLVLSLVGWSSREGHCEHVGALKPVIYDANTRPMVVDSIRPGPYKQPIQVPQHA
jgi:hypothetical protein